MSASPNSTHMLKPLHSTDAVWLEELHKSCFDPLQRWSKDLFATMLAQPPVLGLALIENDTPQGFILGRHVVDECEIITLAITPAARRHGYAQQLVETFLKQKRTQGATRFFLEVAATNKGAIALYEKLGFFTVSTRPNYYEIVNESGRSWVDGLVMVKNFA